MWRFNFYSGIVVLCMLTGCFAKAIPKLKAERYIITAEEDAKSEQWATYAFNHLVKRSRDKSVVELWKGKPLKQVPKEYRIIHFEVAPDLEHDYCIEHRSNKITLQLQNEKTALWITYQFIDAIAREDKRFSASDLPPVIIDFKTACKDFDFSYREPHFLPNLQKGHAPIINTSNVETDWGLWGHNLKKVVENKTEEKVYAQVNKARNPKQFCFSSALLFRYTVNYINNYFGNGTKHSYRFMIMPQDNDLVCTCSSCTKLGNTPSSATPAVSNFMGKLAERFPKHQFFTTAYRTTKEPPKQKLAQNAGVFISTIELPKGIALSNQQPATKKFVQQLDMWKEKTSNVYLWDYAANFDDYLTPVPVLFGLQKQLRFFRKHGIKGIFLNASGYDYSPFDDLKTFIAAALMMDTEVDINTLSKRFFQKNYPQNHRLLADYYLSLEDSFQSKNKAYPMYGGMRESLNTYFDAEEFVRFYNTLKKIIPKTKGKEKENLQKLFTALSFTRLQVAYSKGYGVLGYTLKEHKKTAVKPEVEQWLSELKKYKKYTDLNNYKEADGSLKTYCKMWKTIRSGKPYENLLTGIPIQLLSNPDGRFEDTVLLNNGIPGFAMDYHQGWHISNTDETFRFSSKTLQNAKTIKLRFLVLEKHRFYPPEKIELYSDGELVKTLTEKELNIQNGIAECEVKVNFSGTKNATLKFTKKNLGRSYIACDEIQIN